jgi:hypothetical protein
LLKHHQQGSAPPRRGTEPQAPWPSGRLLTGSIALQVVHDDRARRAASISSHPWQLALATIENCWPQAEGFRLIVHGALGLTPGLIGH